MVLQHPMLTHMHTSGMHRYNNYKEEDCYVCVSQKMLEDCSKGLSVEEKKKLRSGRITSLETKVTQE